jgi:penicillin-binding protein 1C
LAVKAGHFIRYLGTEGDTSAAVRGGRLDTTLDASLQGRVQTILDARLRDLHSREVGDGAVVVLDHSSGEILAWVNGGGDDPQRAESMIDAILTPRQPGSTLKPFLYAAALDAGWSAATIIDDAPLSGAVGSGLHAFRNYSRQFYGPLRLRECLGNSLNTPAVRTLEKLGQPRFLTLLHRLGFASLTRPAEEYGLGLALGNGEVTLLELSRAYAALANRGQRRPLHAVLGATASDPPQQIFTAESASLIADILSHPEARRREVGRGSLLALPLQTAIKTGTSTAYCDAWALGYNHRYVVGVWMGNLDRRPMREVTGALGPALVLRSVMAELGRNAEGAPLFLSPSLISRPICAVSGGAPRPDCPNGREWFRPEEKPEPCSFYHHRHDTARPRAATAAAALLQPSPGLQLAMDPRIPDEFESFAFELAEGAQPQQVEWLVDGRIVATTGPGARRWLWPLQRGPHRAQARITGASGRAQTTAAVDFTVK